MTEDDRVRDLHHGRLHVQGKQHAVFFGLRNLRRQKRNQRVLPHDGRVDDLAGKHGDGVAQLISLAICAVECDPDDVVFGERHREFGGTEVVACHRRNPRPRVRRPSAHRMRIRLGVCLHRRRSTAIRVAFAQHRVDGASLHFVVSDLDRLFLFGLGVVRVIRQGVTLGLQLFNRRHQLRH